MIKRIFLLAILCLAFANNNQASQLKMPSMPFSNTRVALGLGAVAVGAAGYCKIKNYYKWYNKTFVDPQESLKNIKWNLERQIWSVNFIDHSTKELLRETEESKRLDSGVFPFALPLRNVESLIGDIQGSYSRITGLNENQHAEIHEMLQKIREHLDSHGIVKHNGYRCYRCDLYQLSKDHRVGTGCCPDIGVLGKKLQKDLQNQLKTKIPELKQEIKKIDAELVNHTLKIVAHNDKVHEYIGRCGFLTLCGAALFGATRLLSWYRNK